jgi:hypothetical protein
MVEYTTGIDVDLIEMRCLRCGQVDVIIPNDHAAPDNPRRYLGRAPEHAKMMTTEH